MNMCKNFPYPVNLVQEIIGKPLTSDQIKVLKWNPMIIQKLLKTIDERSRDILIARYRDTKTLSQIGEEYGVTKGRIYQIIGVAIHLLRKPPSSMYIDLLLEMDNGYSCRNTAFKQFLTLDDKSDVMKILKIITKNGDIVKFIKENNFAQMLVLNSNALPAFFMSLYDFDTSDWWSIPLDDTTPIEELHLSTRSFNGLYRAGFRTVSQVVNFMNEHPEGFLKIRNLGVTSIKEILNKIVSIGYESFIPESLNRFI